MYRIYINQTPLLLVRTMDMPKYPVNKNVLIGRYTGKKNFFLPYIDTLEKTNKYEMVIIFHENIDKMRQGLFDLFRVDSAGGGLVVNEKNEILLIFRRGFWDLPKGKLDEGETIEQCAVREVIEETGAKNVFIKDKISETYHLFQRKVSARRLIKYTQWFYMTAKKTILRPQAAEQIEKAIWCPISDWEKYKYKMYGNIINVIESALEKGVIKIF